MSEVNESKEVEPETLSVDGNKSEESAELVKVNAEIRAESIENVNRLLNPASYDKDGNRTESKATGTGKEDLEAGKKSTQEAKDNSTKEDASNATQAVEEQVAALNLPSRLIQAAKRNHLEPQEILDLGDKADLVLTRLAENSDRVSAELGEIGRKAKVALTKPQSKEVKPTLEVVENEDDEPEVKNLKKVVRGLTSKLADIEQRDVERNTALTQREVTERDTKIDGFFDGIEKEFPEFGNTKTLTKAQIALRQSVWATADDIMIGAGVTGQSKTLEESLSDSFSIYESKSPKQKVSREKLLDEVKQRESQLITRGASKKGSSIKPTGRDAAAQAVKDWYRKKGMISW